MSQSLFDLFNLYSLCYYTSDKLSFTQFYLSPLTHNHSHLHFRSQYHTKKGIPFTLFIFLNSLVTIIESMHFLAFTAIASIGYTSY